MTAQNRPHRPSRGARSLSREFALLGVYQWLVSGTDAQSIDANLLSVLSDEDDFVAGSAIDVADFERCDKAHFSELLKGVIDNATDRAEIINANQRSNTATDTDGNMPGNTVVLNRKTRSVDIDPHK